MSGLSTNGSISLGEAFVAGRKRVPSPAAGIMALRTGEGMERYYEMVYGKVKEAHTISTRVSPLVVPSLALHSTRRSL